MHVWPFVAISAAGQTRILIGCDLLVARVDILGAFQAGPGYYKLPPLAPSPTSLLPPSIHSDDHQQVNPKFIPFFQSFNPLPTTLINMTGRGKGGKGLGKGGAKRYVPLFTLPS